TLFTFIHRGRAQCSNPAMSIIGAEDEDFENDLNDLNVILTSQQSYLAPIISVADDQCTFFNNIEQLKERPTHLLVFMHHVILQFDPAPLLCYLHADLFKTLSAKETKKQFVEFYNTFLDKGAILRVFVPSNISYELDRTRPDLLSEDTQRRYAQEVQGLQAAEVAKQLDDFRQKRMMGMTPNAAELLDVESHYPTDRVPMEMKEKSVAENLLDKMSEIQPTIVSDEEKCQSIFTAVAFYMKHLGVKTRTVDSKKPKGGFFRRQLVKQKIALCNSLFVVLPSFSNHLGPSCPPPIQSDAGDVSPVVLVGGLTAGEPILPSDIPTEDNVEKDSVDGPITVFEGPGQSPTSPSPQVEEMEPRLLEFEQDPPNWRELASPEALSSLTKQETKRQEVINELFTTEHAHVRMLSVLQVVFAKPLERVELLTATELSAIFPNLDDIIEMHYNFYQSLKKLRVDNQYIVKSISTTVHNLFGGPEGDWFQKLTARFCSHQSWALDQIKSRQKREPRFNTFIQEAESKPQCRRLQLKDIIPIEMQRLTKYPLLLENIAKNTGDLTEKEKIQQSAECCRKILNHVNEEVKMMENLLTLKDYQRKLDTSGLKPSNELYTEYKNIDLTQKKMLYEGPLTWRVTKEKAIEIQCVLLGDLLVLLQRQDDKMVLKCQSKSNIAVQEGKQMLSPIIKLDSVFLREVATDRKAFYVIFTWESGAQIYELVAQSVGERKMWTDVIKLAVDDLKKSGTTLRLQLPPVGGGAPFSPSTYVSVCVCSLVCSVNKIHSLPAKVPQSQNISFLLLIDFLSDKGFDLIGHSNSVQEKVAHTALDDVFTSTEESHATDRGAKQEDNNNCEKEGAGTKREEEQSISAPLVLSHERIEEVCRRLTSLEEHLKRLQTVEEEYHRLQEALSKFSLQRGNFN
uniref:Rho guanine nucleotide exchange factor (GEF) 1 n=1 Tax=Mastacembelus armatus TaxID=205130 RepID=A0A7N9B1X8_9TELE